MASRGEPTLSPSHTNGNGSSPAVKAGSSSSSSGSNSSSLQRARDASAAARTAMAAASAAAQAAAAALAAGSRTASNGRGRASSARLSSGPSSSADSAASTDDSVNSAANGLNGSASLATHKKVLSAASTASVVSSPAESPRTTASPSAVNGTATTTTSGSSGSSSKRSSSVSRWSKEMDAQAAAAAASIAAAASVAAPVDSTLPFDSSLPRTPSRPPSRSHSHGASTRVITHADLDADVASAYYGHEEGLLGVEQLQHNAQELVAQVQKEMAFIPTPPMLPSIPLHNLSPASLAVVVAPGGFSASRPRTPLQQQQPLHHSSHHATNGLAAYGLIDPLTVPIPASFDPLPMHSDAASVVAVSSASSSSSSSSLLTRPHAVAASAGSSSLLSPLALGVAASSPSSAAAAAAGVAATGAAAPVSSPTSNRPVETEVTVSVRVRPLNAMEIHTNQFNAWSYSRSEGPISPQAARGRHSITLLPSAAHRVEGAPAHSSGTSLSAAPSFTFDYLFTPSHTNQEIFGVLGQRTLNQVTNGFHACLFAYGQTASGKTYSIHGQQHDPGMIPLAVQGIFDHIEANPQREYVLRVAYIEVYCEVVNDLLNPLATNLPIRESASKGIYIDGLQESVVISPDQVFALLSSGEAQRHVGKTNYNEISSRSHTIFQMVVESTLRTGALSNQGKKSIRSATLNLVDLAGSENAIKAGSGSGGVRVKESGYINRSLLTLGHVIYKLSEGTNKRGAASAAAGPTGHIPYRDSKLTRLLQASLSGVACVSVICTISPSSGNVDETLSTLKFARRAKRIRTAAVANEVLDPSTALILQYRREIERLRAELEGWKLRHAAEVMAKQAAEESEALAAAAQHKQQQRHRRSSREGKDGNRTAPSRSRKRKSGEGGGGGTEEGDEESEDEDDESNPYRERDRLAQADAEDEEEAEAVALAALQGRAHHRRRSSGGGQSFMQSQENTLTAQIEQLTRLILTSSQVPRAGEAAIVLPEADAAALPPLQQHASSAPPVLASPAAAAAAVPAEMSSPPLPPHEHSRIPLPPLHPSSPPNLAPSAASASAGGSGSGAIPILLSSPSANPNANTPPSLPPSSSSTPPLATTPPHASLNSRRMYEHALAASASAAAPPLLSSAGKKLSFSGLLAQPHPDAAVGTNTSSSGSASTPAPEPIFDLSLLPAGAYAPFFPSQINPLSSWTRPQIEALYLRLLEAYTRQVTTISAQQMAAASWTSWRTSVANRQRALQSRFQCIALPHMQRIQQAVAQQSFFLPPASGAASLSSAGSAAGVAAAPLTLLGESGHLLSEIADLLCTADTDGSTSSSAVPTPNATPIPMSMGGLDGAGVGGGGGPTGNSPALNAVNASSNSPMPPPLPPWNGRARSGSGSGPVMAVPGTSNTAGSEIDVRQFRSLALSIERSTSLAAAAAVPSTMRPLYGGSASAVAIGGLPPDDLSPSGIVGAAHHQTIKPVAARVYRSVAGSKMKNQQQLAALGAAVAPTTQANNASSGDAAGQ